MNQVLMRLLPLYVVAMTALAVPTGVVEAQEIGHMHDHPVLQSIEEARDAGELSDDEAILQMHYAAYRPDKLSESFRSDAEQGPIKCMVPVTVALREIQPSLAASTIEEIEQMTQGIRSVADYSYVSPSGRFIFHYNTSGADAVPTEQTLPGAIEAGIPDYIYRAAFAADSSYRYQVEDVGFTDFSRDTPYEIRFDNFGFYGTTTASGSMSFITLHNNFIGFPENSHPEGGQIGALYVTLAHEIKHAIQYEANRWRGSAGSFNWIEMDATLMEEVVFDDVNDYYNYIKNGFSSSRPSSTSIFGSPHNPTPGAYYHITWMLYFTETYGVDFWVDVWEVVSDDPVIPFTEAIERVLQERDGSLGREHITNHMWHMLSGAEFAGVDFGFEERALYPDPFVSSEFFTVPDSLARTSLRPFAANYIKASVPNIAIGRPGITLDSDASGVGLGVIGLFTDGSVRTEIVLNETSSRQVLTTNWNWGDLREMLITVVNTNQSQSADYTIALESVVPEQDILARNYPNPFNPSTRIEFSINSPKDVRLDVFDSIGRRVATLIDGPLNEGFHFVDFDGSGLSSGVYFYRISTNEQTQTRKMLLVK